MYLQERKKDILSFYIYVKLKAYLQEPPYTEVVIL